MQFVRKALRIGNDVEQVRQFGARMFVQVLAARVHADDEVAGKIISVAKCKFAVTSSQVQQDAIVVCEPRVQVSHIQIKGRFAPNCFHLKPPICRVDKSGTNWSGAERGRPC